MGAWCEVGNDAEVTGFCGEKFTKGSQHNSFAQNLHSTGVHKIDIECGFKSTHPAIFRQDIVARHAGRNSWWWANIHGYVYEK